VHVHYKSAAQLQQFYLCTSSTLTSLPSSSNPPVPLVSQGIQRSTAPAARPAGQLTMVEALQRGLAAAKQQPTLQPPAQQQQQLLAAATAAAGRKRAHSAGERKQAAWPQEGQHEHGGEVLQPVQAAERVEP
jgi:hypothetical protein